MLPGAMVPVPFLYTLQEAAFMKETIERLNE